LAVVLLQQEKLRFKQIYQISLVVSGTLLITLGLVTLPEAPFQEDLTSSQYTLAKIA